MWSALPSCFRLLWQVLRYAACRPRARYGKISPIRSKMMARVTITSMKVNPGGGVRRSAFGVGGWEGAFTQRDTDWTEGHRGNSTQLQAFLVRSVPIRVDP